jgi:hypothetical protein
MTEIFRGMLTILSSHVHSLMDELRVHIRSFNPDTSPTPLDEVDGFRNTNGFWNLILEVVLNLYVLTVSFFGVILTLVLAVIAYPFRLFGDFYANLFINSKLGPGPIAFIEPTIHEQETKNGSGKSKK